MSCPFNSERTSLRLVKIKFDEHTVAVAQMSFAHCEIDVMKDLTAADDPFKILDLFIVVMRM